FIAAAEHNDGDRQEKGKPGGGDAIKAQRQGGGHGNARPRGAGNQRQGLGNANDKGLPPTQGRHQQLLRRQPIRQPQHQAKDYGGQGNHQHRAQMGLNEIVKQQPGKASGNRGQHNQPRQPAFCRGLTLHAVTRPGHHQAAQVVAKIPQHGSQGAHVNGDIKGQPLVGPAKQRRGQNQVRGTGNGQKFRNTLDNGQHNNLQQGQGASCPAGLPARILSHFFQLTSLRM